MLSAEERDFLLVSAFRADPDNPIYSLRIAVDLLRKKDLESATEVLGSAAERGALHTICELARKSLSGNPDANFGSLTREDGFFTQRDWDVLQAHSGVVPWVDYYLGMRFISMGDERNAMKLFARADSMLRECPLVGQKVLATNTVRTSSMHLHGDFEQHGAAVIEKVRKERPQDYLKVAAALLPKQMEIETNRIARPFSELSDAELLNIMLNGRLDVIVEGILVFRGHPRPTSVQRQQLQEWEQEVAPANTPQKAISES